MQLRVKRLHARAELPARSSEAAAGYDLVAALDGPTEIAGGETALIPSGVVVEIPLGYFGLVKDRSSVALRGLHTAAGVIDADYRGEVKVMLHNVTNRPQAVEPGERIAQMILVAHAAWEVVEAEELGSTARGDGGFGSTGRSGRTRGE